MACPAATILFDSYARAATEYFEATDDLSNLVGRHGRFEEQQKHTERLREKCSIAHLALKQHWKEHHCQNTPAHFCGTVF